MEPKNFSKLQIRAEILAAIQRLASFSEAPQSEKQKCLARLETLGNKKYVAEILCKELTRSDERRLKAVAFFTVELCSLEDVKEDLWSCIKDPNFSDYVKDTCAVVLRELGDTTDPGIFLSFLENPSEVIDQETEKLLMNALVNPEAVVDFLDFLYSLPENEQQNLIGSLNEDYTGNHLANILVTTLETMPPEDIQLVLTEALGETKSEIPVPILHELVKYSQIPSVQRAAKKSLSMLKLSGINTSEDAKDIRGKDICDVTEAYECFAGYIDGAGSQGIIVSRIKPEKDILMFSVVVNDIEGVIDCFGFGSISVADYERIVSRFTRDALCVKVSSKYCGYVLKKAEAVNKKNNTPMPYEYIAWKNLTYDFPQYENNPEDELKAKFENNISNNPLFLFNFPEMKYWFLDENDSPYIKPFIKKILDKIHENIETYLQNATDLENLLNDEINNIIPTVFDKEFLEIYAERLINIALLFDFQNLDDFSKCALNLALDIRENAIGSDNKIFFETVMQKTLIEGFLRYKQIDTAPKTESRFVSRFPKKLETSSNKLTPEFLEKFDIIIEVLCAIWKINGKISK